MRLRPAAWSAASSTRCPENERRPPVTRGRLRGNPLCLQRAASGSPRFEDGECGLHLPLPTTTTRRFSWEEERRVRASPEPVSESLVRRPPFARLSEEAKGAWRLVRRPLRSHRFQRTPRSNASRLTTAPRGDLASPTPSSAFELRALDADPPRRRSPERGGRLEEPPKPIRPLSVAVATKAPMRAAFRRCARQLVSARQSVRRFTFETRARGDVAGLERRSPCSDTLPSCRNPRARGPETSRVSRARTPPDAIPLRLARAVWSVENPAVVRRGPKLRAPSLLDSFAAARRAPAIRPS